MKHSVTARDVPEARHDIADWFTSPGATSVFARLAAGQRANSMPAAQAAAKQMIQRQSSLRLAELYYVNADMTDLAIQVARGLREWFVTDDAPVENHGFVVWERPLPVDDGPPALWPIAASWSRLDDKISVDTYGYAPALMAEAHSRGLLAKGFAGHLVQLRAGKLAFLASTKLRKNHDVTGLPGLLLATWLLIRQPAEHRQAIHEIEHLPAPRSAQKRILRGGGDPTRTVRYITLRQTLRRAEGDTEPGQARSQKIYRHRWFVAPHRVSQYYPSTGTHQKIWRGPYLVVPKGCEGAPILGGERVNVLRR